MHTWRTIWTGLLVIALAGCKQPGTEETGGQVRVTTVPPEATVACDGVFHDVSPVTLTGLEAGSHLLSASKDGYVEARRTVALLSGQKMAVEMTLEPVLGLVLVHSQPSGVDVQMDGAFRGQTPLLIPDCPLGTHRLHLQHAGFLDKELVLNVTDRTPRKIDAQLTPDTAQLEVNSEPGGAVVRINGVEKGRTPLTIEAIPSGECKVEVRRRGYHAYEDTLTLSAGDVKTVAATLSPLLGGLQVVSVPSGARVYVSDEFRGTTPLTLEDLPPERCRVRVEKKGYETDARDVMVPPRDVVTEEFRLIKNSGLLIITTIPSGVKVFVDGNVMGTTPGNDTQLSEPLELDLLSRGKHVIQLSRKGYARKSKTITIRPDQVVTLHEELTRLYIPDTIVRIGDGAGDVRKGVLLEQSPRGDIRLEINPGVIIEIKAEEIREIKRLSTE